MKQFFAGIYFFVLLLAACPAAGQAAGEDAALSLCPQVDKYRLQRTFYFSPEKEVVRAPASAAAVQARLAELSSPNHHQRQAAIIALALAGNLELFDRLLETGDGDGLELYARHYLRADGSICLAPRIEAALVHHFADGRFRQGFLSFFDNNLYSDQALVAPLAPPGYDASNPERFAGRVKALCATRLPGLEERLLAIADLAMAHDTATRKRLMPGVHQSLIRYFGDQRLPVFAYYRQVLAAEPRSEQVVFFQENYAKTRLAIYQALVHYDSPESFAILVEQLEELGRQGWGPYFINDLNALSDHLTSHPLFATRKRALLPVIGQILATPSLPSQEGYLPPWEKAGEPFFYDQQVRSRLYDLLARIDGDEAARLLLEELASLGQRSVEQGRQELVHVLFSCLARLAEAPGLDVDQLLNLAKQAPTIIATAPLAAVLVQHPTTAGLDFLLHRFGEAVRGTGRAGTSQQEAAQLFSILLQFSKAQYLYQTREVVDGLFVEGVLPEATYVALSKQLAKRLGEDSPTLQSVLAAHKKEREQRRQQELARKQATWQQEMAQEYAHQSSPAGIAANIEALHQFGPQAKRATYWLIRVGAPVLPQVHAALADEMTNRASCTQLLLVLGEIGDVSSTIPIVQAVQKRHDGVTLLQQAMLALAKIPQTTEAVTFASHWLDDPQASERQVISALAYFAGHGDQRGLDWSRRFATAAHSPALRAAALYFGARLADQGVTAQIVDMLATGPAEGVRDLLWLALGEVAGPKEFAAIQAELDAKPSAQLSQIEQYVRFRHSRGPAKIKLAHELLTASTPLYSERATTFLLENDEYAVLAPYLEQYGDYSMSLEMILYKSAVAQRIFTEARRHGYHIEEKDGTVRFCKKRIRNPQPGEKR